MRFLGRPSPATAVVATALACVVAAAPSCAWASGPPPPPAAHELYAAASVVFVGRVESVGKATMEVRVVETLKGERKAGDAGTVTVGPIFEEECSVRPEAERTPIYRAGDRILVAARRVGDSYAVVGNRYGGQDLGDDASVARVVAFAREILRIVALPDAGARREATIATLLSPDPAFADAAEWYQIGELNAPEKSRPHAAALAAALRAPVPLARKVALRALRGVAAPEAWERVVELTEDPDDETAEEAATTLAAYASDEAVAAIERAAAAPGRRALLFHLAASPRPLAHRRLHERVASGTAADRLLAYQVLGRRIARAGTTDEDVADLLSFLRSDAAATVETHEMVEALGATRSMTVARALVEIVSEAAAGPCRRHVAYWVLNVWVRVWPEALDYVREEEAPFVARLDEDEPRSQLVELLGRIHSAAARAAIERAAASHPDEHTRKAARSALEAW